MKKLVFLTFAFIVALSNIISAKVSAEALNYGSTNCHWYSQFKYPNGSQTFYYGDPVYVRVHPQKNQHINYMILYCDNQYIRKESSYPYEWCKSSGGDNYLRTLSPGWHELKCKIYDKCGKCHIIKYKVYIKAKGGGGNACYFNNPCYDLPWLKQIKQQHPDWAIYQYKKNGQPYFKIFKCGVSHYDVYWYDCHGKLICKCSNGSNCFPGCSFVKCWYNPCQGGGGNQGGNCNWDSWFKYPQNGKYFNHGCDVYVRVECKKHHDIAYMELYCNGQKIRKESMYPYEWCKGNGNSDYLLRNMKKGQYNLVCVIVDKCGHKHEKKCTFYVS
ncbi:MAG: hypothetical protein HKN76_16345 [Saprospiraceae bacterium]|nr:hypothetical protein [Saprospiraceae bacterium]